MEDWWQNFFDEEYFRLWDGVRPVESTEREVEGLWELLQLRPTLRVLDAPCGYGRIACGLAERGAEVLGVDYSADLLREAEQRRDSVPAEKLRYLRHDLRQPLEHGNFHVALNIFSSLGYGNETDDLAILKTLAHSVRPGGLVFLETVHRDAYVRRNHHSKSFAMRHEDGTLLLEEPKLDAISGRADITWYYSGPRGAGKKTANIRIYTVTELVRLVEAAGLTFRSAYAGCSAEPFTGQHRVGLLAARG